MAVKLQNMKNSEITEQIKLFNWARSVREFNGLYIEMKFGSNKPTKDQVEFMAMLKDQGYKTAVIYSAEEARSLIRHYLARADNFDLVNCEEAPKIFGCCEGIEADWTPCANCELYKKNKQPEW